MKQVTWTNEPSWWSMGRPYVLTAFSGAVHTDPRRMWGNPTLAGTRVPLFRVIELFQADYSPNEIGTEIYPHLGPERVINALRQVGYDFLDTSDEPMRAVV